MKPTARRDELELQQVDDELVVYDLRNDHAHCLHPLAAQVWELADGSRDVPAILDALGDDASGDWGDLVEDDVWAALDALDGADLLMEQPGPPMGERRISRRDLVRGVAQAGAFGMVTGVVHSIIAPTPASAQSGTGGSGEANQKEAQLKADAKAQEQAQKQQAEEDLKQQQEQNQKQQEQSAKEAQSKQQQEQNQKQQEQSAKEAQAKGGG